jgi:hypothetical protein
MYGDIFLITSVINTGVNPWSYCGTRSIFSTEDRYKQTVDTIESIRKIGSNTRIIMVECSSLSDEKEATLKSLVDIYINIYGEAEGIKACLETNKKGFGEAVQSLRAIEYISKNNILFDRLFKISGRYFLNENFDDKKYSMECFTFKAPSSENSHSTVIYSVPHSLVDKYEKSLRQVIDYYNTDAHEGYENLFPRLLNPKIVLDTMGVTGLVAVNGEYFTC